ncbi:MAG: flagellar basal-body rod protein FlgB [Planctomycetaceae bacterium]|nr:flagellar basal-body rod protein FlgB [Planctomycetaceae bacterium]
MLDTLFQSSTLPLLEQVVSFTQARHGVLAGNLANVDTPGYVARDLSPEAFQERLKTALAESKQRGPNRAQQNPYLEHQSPGVTEFQPARTAMQRAKHPYEGVRDSMKGMLRHDDNDISIEHQVAEISKNHAQHNMALTVMNSQFRLLKMIISERP